MHLLGSNLSEQSYSEDMKKGWIQYCRLDVFEREIRPTMKGESSKNRGGEENKQPGAPSFQKYQI